MNMNLIEELKALDFNDIGRWPLLFRAAFVGQSGHKRFSRTVTTPTMPFSRVAQAARLPVRCTFTT
jgi:hypothetical protein